MTEHREVSTGASPRAREQHAARRVPPGHRRPRVATLALAAGLLATAAGCGVPAEEAVAPVAVKAELKDTGWDAADAAPTPESAATPDIHEAQQAATAFLAAGPASRDGLIAQLEFEGYPVSEATRAVDQLAVDWERQAARSAAGYLRTMPFSRDGLVDQLLSEGFTPEQAEHAVTEVGL